MGRREVNCLGGACEHFREYYQVDNYEGGYMPRFGQTSRHCRHPLVYTTLGNTDDTGALIHTLKECPKETNNK